MARLRDDYKEFVKRGAEVLAVGPDSASDFDRYWRTERLPFVGLPDPGHEVAGMYKQQVNFFKLGRMPLVTVIDPAGLIRFAHYGASMSDIPENGTLLNVIDQIRAEIG